MSSLLLLTIFVHINQALYTIYSTNITGPNITCDQNDDCSIICTDCTKGREIYCQPDYSCSINCEQCENSFIYAINVTNINITCINCDSANIIITLNDLDSQSQLNCISEPNEIGLLTTGCQGADITIDHTKNIYQLTTMSTNIHSTATVNCSGTSACSAVYIDSTINGYFSGICNGSSTCNRATMIYNPPSENKGQMHLQCLSNVGFKQACIYTHFMSLSARHIFVQCGDGTIDYDSQVCYRTYITGPVLPYNDTITSYYLSNINEDSIVIDCNYYQCNNVYVFAPFGAFQTTALRETYDVRYTCGWDFPSTGWNFPQRLISCDDRKEVRGIILHTLQQGADIIVTNKFNDNYICEDGKHCVVYGMDRGIPQTHITCPADTVSFCYVLAMQTNGLSNSIIDGSAIQHLLLTGFDESAVTATDAFTGAIIYAPNGTLVPNGTFSIPAGNNVNSFSKAIIYADETPFTFIPKTMSGFIGATMYFANSDWIHIECDYHDMCKNLSIYIDNPDFTKTNIFPDNGNNFCIACDSRSSFTGCEGMTVTIKGPKTYIFEAVRISDLGWFWQDIYGYRWTTPIPDTYDVCKDKTETILDYSWYWWYDEFSDAPPCNWFLSNEYSPPVYDFCFMDPRGMAWKQYCENGQPVFVIYSFRFGKEVREVRRRLQDRKGENMLMPGRKVLPGMIANCSGNGTYMTPEDAGVPADCSININSIEPECEYATYTFRTYMPFLDPGMENREFIGDIGPGFTNMSAAICNETSFLGIEQQAVFVDQCIISSYYEPAKYYMCNRWNNTLTLIEYNNTENCTGEYIIKAYTKGDCLYDNDNGYEIFVEDIQCYGYPTPEPTLPPTPICLSVTVNVTDAHGLFDENDFNGLYTYNSIESQFDAKIWEMPSDPHGQNVRYYDGNWIIHGKGYNVLMHKVQSPQLYYSYAFPPYEDLTAEWIYSKIDTNYTFHIWIRCIDSFAPTTTPTESPTDSIDSIDNNNDQFVITSDDRNYGSLGIVYVFTNLTSKNYDFILNNVNGKEYVKDLIEKHYFHAKYLPSYEYFQITVLKLNGVVANEATIAIINSENILFVGALIEFKSEYEYYLLETSKNPEWATNVTETFIEYFNNTKLEFYVANSSSLTSSITVEEEEIISPSFGATFGTLNAILFICFIISIFAYLYNKYSYQWICEKNKFSKLHFCGIETELTPVDAAAWLAPTMYGLAIYDIISDINLTSEIWTVMGANTISNRTKEYLLMVSGWGMLLCILIPYCMNIYFAAKIPRKTASNMQCRTYFAPSGNLSLFITLVVFSGSCYSSLDLVASGIFGLSIADCGLTSFELAHLSEKRVLIIVLSYNIPSIIMQIFYAYSIGLISPNTTLAFCTSFASIVGSLLTYIIHRDKKGIVHNVDYYFQIKHFDESDLNDAERKHIDTIKSMKQELSQNIVNTYGVIPIENFEISFVTIRRDDFVIRIVQHLHEQDLQFNITQKKILTNTDQTIERTKSYSMEIEDEYDTYCRNLYMSYRKKIDTKIFEHYCELEKEVFSIEYHSVFPGSLDNIPQINDNENEYNYGNIENIMEHAMTGGYNNQVTANTYIYNTNGELQENIVTPPEIMNSHYEFWHDRRDQFSKGYELIKIELEKLKKENGNDFTVNSMQIHRFIRILNDNNINPTVIEDVINFSIKSKTFNRRSRRNSDIDISRTDTNYLVDQEIEMWAKENN